MDAAPLLPAPAELRLTHLAVDSTGVTVIATTRRPTVQCPQCATPATRVHSRYTRTLADLPWHGEAVRLVVTTRRFFCDRPACPRQIFTERLPHTAGPFARRTTRLAAALDAIGLALGGAAGARLAASLGLATSGDTIRRLVVQRPICSAAAPTPRVLGVDDWAWRRGHRYGTILVDLERRCVVDLLPDRLPATLAAWLIAHPGVEIVSRDRGGGYADAARAGAPEAIQVADRFHLLRNLGDAIDRAVTRHHTIVRDIAVQHGGPVLPRAAVLRRRISGLPHNTGGPSKAEQASADRRLRRFACYERVLAYRRDGRSLAQIAHEMGLSTRTLKRWLAVGHFPERRSPQARPPSILAPFMPWLRARYDAGVENASQLTRELRTRGYRGSVNTVRYFLLELRRTGPPRAAPTLPAPPPARVTPRQTRWLLARPEDVLTPEDRAYITHLTTACSALGNVRTLALAFQTMLRTHDVNALSQWLACAHRSELRHFAAGIERDRNAVVAAILFQWSNGQVEGHIHRLKLLKRQSYGRASFDYLRHRVLRAA